MLPKSPPGRFPWRPAVNDVLGIVGLFALTRILLVGVGVFAWGWQLERSSWRGVDRSGIRYSVVPNQPLMDMWTRWDSWQYEEIARSGYWYDREAKPRPYGTVACFPLYPMMIRGVGRLLGGQYVVAGLLIANTSALVGFVLLFQWVVWWGDRRSAWVAVALAVCFPVGHFWSSVYPQSLFFALTVGSLTLMLDGRVALACLLGALATATRLEGVALLPALLAIHLQNRRWRVGREILWLAITPLGLLSYMAYLYWRWGDPVLFLKVHALFGRGLTDPFSTLAQPWSRPLMLRDPIVLGTYATGLLLGLGHLARVRWPILLYGWTLYLIPLCSGVYMSIYRVHLVNVPLFLAVGLGLVGRWRILAWLLVACCLATELFSMFLWVIGYFLP